MTTVDAGSGGASLHPLHSILLAFPLALFSSALISDIAYLRTAVIQWSNFSAWLITGALVFGGFALAWRSSTRFSPAGQPGDGLCFFSLSSRSCGSPA